MQAAAPLNKPVSYSQPQRQPRQENRGLGRFGGRAADFDLWPQVLIRSLAGESLRRWPSQSYTSTTRINMAQQYQPRERFASPERPWQCRSHAKSPRNLLESRQNLETVIWQTKKKTQRGLVSKLPLSQSRLAIEAITPFNSLYQKFKGGKLPAPEVMKDALQEVDLDDRHECVDIFIGNAKYVGMLKVVSGAEWILSIEEVLAESLDEKKSAIWSSALKHQEISTDVQASDFDTICFFIAPIGEEGGEKRKHSDMVLETLVDHAIKPQKLKVIRADKITQPGMISKQIIEYIIKSKLVIADMSFHNPNVFYELAIRHLLGKPTVHLIRKRDKIPFDVGNFRTIEIDDSDMYELIAKIETYRADIANHVREALEGSSSADNPILTFFPDLKVSLNDSSR